MNTDKNHQQVLFEMPPEQPYPALILSIRDVHVDRIFQGTKLFELRKTLPNTQFRRVYLYETGTGKGVVGCFDVKKTYDSVPLSNLWEIVGDLGTTKERFDKYFNGRQAGCAIEIARPVKFRESVIPATLKNKKPNFTAPMSYAILSPSEKLYAYLEAKRVEEMGAREIGLRLIEPDEYAAYRKMVTEEISKNYDDITNKFADSILKAHELGYDPRGIFTMRKEVYSIIAQPEFLVGFTTITYKIGGSAKTGPTVLFEEFRNRGYGKAVRRKIEEICREKRARKIYCTCADNQSGVLRYLLNGDMRVEAHLTDHYSASHGEFVLGKMIEPSPSIWHVPNRVGPIAAAVAEATGFEQDELADSVREYLQESGYDIDAPRCLSIVEGVLSGTRKEYEEKPLQMVCLEAQGRCLGFAILIPKRGGAVKVLVACSTSHVGSMDSLLREAENRVRRLGKRKIYVNHNLTDHAMIERLMNLGYQVEGVLKQPYKAGVDHLILSKKLR